MHRHCPARYWHGEQLHTLILLIMETLTNEQILEGNKLLAEFMGKKIITDGISWFDTYYNALPRYDLSWDWLMPVVEKILTTDYETDNCIFDKHYHSLHDAVWSLNLESVWLACVEFAKWYKAQI